MTTKMQGIWEKESDKDRKAKIILFLISPLLSLLYSLPRLRQKSSLYVIFGFCVFFGLAFTVGKERYENSGDGITYRIQFEEYRNDPGYLYLLDLQKYLEFDSGAKDFYADTVSFLVSRVTGNYHVLFMIYAIIFSFFQLKSLRFFIKANKYKSLSYYVFCLLLLFTFNQIFNINGVRFWTAAWIAVYSVLQIFYNNKKIYLLLALFTPFVHGSYFLFLFVLVFALLTKKFKSIWAALFITSFLFSTVAVDVFNAAFDYLPSFMANTASAYLDEDNIAEHQNQTGTGFWVIGKAFNIMERLFINLLVLILIINRKLITDKNANSLMAFLLVIISVANFTMPIPSVGVRFIQLTYPLIALLYVQYMPENRYGKLVLWFPIIFIFSFYYLFLNYLEVVGVSFFFLSPVIIVFKTLL